MDLHVSLRAGVEVSNMSCISKYWHTCEILSSTGTPVVYCYTIFRWDLGCELYIDDKNRNHGQLTSTLVKTTLALSFLLMTMNAMMTLPMVRTMMTKASPVWPTLGFWRASRSCLGWTWLFPPSENWTSSSAGQNPLLCKPPDVIVIVM